MKKYTRLKTFGLLMTAMSISFDVQAGPDRCSYGFEDSTCAPTIWRAPQQQPTCSTDPGWVMTAAAQWMGSGYTSPQCSYQAPPSCPGGYTQTASPWWTGSSWMGLQCTPSVPPRASEADQRQACVNTAATYGKYVRDPSIFVGPQSETTGQVANDIRTLPPPRICQAPGTSFAGNTYGSQPPTDGPHDVYKSGFSPYVLTNSNAGDEGHIYNETSLIMACMLAPGTTQVVGFRLAQSQSAIGGPCGR